MHQTSSMASKHGKALGWLQIPNDGRNEIRGPPSPCLSKRHRTLFGAPTARTRQGVHSGMIQILKPQTMQDGHSLLESRNALTYRFVFGALARDICTLRSWVAFSSIFSANSAGRTSSPRKGGRKLRQPTCTNLGSPTLVIDLGTAVTRSRWKIVSTFMQIYTTRRPSTVTGAIRYSRLVRNLGTTRYTGVRRVLS